jgi:4a-hydroxytetrahydrobiopterin dehydratase
MMLIRLSISRNSGLPTSFQHSKPHAKLALFLTLSRKMSSQPSPTFSSNYSPEQGTKDLSPLLKAIGGKWVLTESGKGVERSFKFKTFKKTWVCLSAHILSFSSIYEVQRTGYKGG